MESTRRRCSECRATFTPSPTAGSKQRVCGEACRSQRDRKLARRRRTKDLAGHREDERLRQRAHRAAVCAGTEAAARHAPASPSKQQELHAKMAILVDRVWALSRARMLRDLSGIVALEGAKLADTG